MNFLIWNVRGIAKPQSKARLQHLITNQCLGIIGLLEPMILNPQPIRIIRKFKMQGIYINCNNKIWLLWKAPFQVDILDQPQFIHTRVTFDDT